MPPRTARGAWLRALDEDECASAIFANNNRTGEVRRVITLNLEPRITNVWPLLPKIRQTEDR